MSSENAKAKALLEQAGERLDEALNLVEECTDKHDTIGSACDDLDFVMNHLDFVMHQMWPNENSEPWLDGTDPMKHAADCAMFLAEVTGEEDGAPSTELVAEAMENVWEAATLLWGSKWKAVMDCRLQAKAQAMGVAEAREAADNYARMEYAEPSRPRECWGMRMPNIDEPTGAALHLLGAVANLDYYRLATEGTAISGGIEGAMDHIESAVDILWPEREEDTAERIRELAKDIHDNRLTIFDMNDMESMGEANMADARAKARSYEARDETEAAEFAANVADGINRVAVTCAYASCTPGIDEGMRETLEGLAKKAKAMLVEAVSVCNHLNGHTTAKSATTDGEIMGGIPYVEVGYEDGSKTRLTGHFGMDTMADVARLMAYRNADEAEEA